MDFPERNVELMAHLDDERIKHPNDVRHDLRLIEDIRSEINFRIPAFDRDRILVLASVCEKGDSKMRVTLPRILQQADEIGKKCDVLMGINCGMRLPYTESELQNSGLRFEELFSAHDAVDDHGHHSVYGNEFLSGNERMITDIREDLHRVFCVRQYAHPQARGKNKMLKVLNDVTIKSMTEGAWRFPPSHVLEIDDDSRFYDGLRMDANGIALLYKEMEINAVSAIGARWRTVRYAEENTQAGPVSNPDFALPFDNAYKYIDTSQSEWMRFLPGGGALGETDLMLACRWPIGHRYPSSRSDDVHRTIYVGASGAPWKISDYGYVLNESRNSDDQILRWLKGTFGLRRILGRKYFNVLYNRSDLPEEMKKVPPNLDLLMSRACLDADTSLQQGSSDW